LLQLLWKSDHRRKVVFYAVAARHRVAFIAIRNETFTMNDQPVASDQSAQISQMSFEQALSQLDTIVRRLESGDVELDAAVGAFEQGVLLKRHCETKLAAARERVEKITSAPDGTKTLSPLPEMK